MKKRRILITGGAGALGGAVTALLRDQGHEVVGIDRVAGPEIITADLCDAAAAHQAVEAGIRRLGGLDVLVNNAGIADLQDSGLPASERVRQILEINFFAAWSVTAAAMPALLESRGRVVNIASMLAFLNLPFLAAYCASKRALAGFSDTLRIEYGSALEVVTIYPGYVRTPMHEAGDRQGLSLAGLVPEEPLPQAATTIATACVGRPRRDVAVSLSGWTAMHLGRSAPRLLDRLVTRRIRQLAKRGGLREVELAAPLVRRLTGGAPRGEVAAESPS